MTDRDLTRAIERYICDNPGVHPSVLAVGIVGLMLSHGWRHRIERPEPWQHHGAGIPSEGSEGAELVAAYRARQAAETALPGPEDVGYEWRREQLAELDGEVP